MNENFGLLSQLGTVQTATDSKSSVSTGTKPKEGLSLFDSIFAQLNQDKSQILPKNEEQSSTNLKNLSPKTVEPQAIEPQTASTKQIIGNIENLSKIQIDNILKNGTTEVQPKTEPQPQLKNQPQETVKPQIDKQTTIQASPQLASAPQTKLETSEITQSSETTQKLDNKVVDNKVINKLDNKIVEPKSQKQDEHKLVQQIDKPNSTSEQNLTPKVSLFDFIVNEIETQKVPEIKVSKPEIITELTSNALQNTFLSEEIQASESALPKRVKSNNDVGVASKMQTLFESLTQGIVTPSQDAKVVNEIIQEVSKIELAKREVVVQEFTPKENILNSMLQSSQKISVQLASLANISEANKLMNAEPTTKNLKKVANLLDLGLESISKIEELRTNHVEITQQKETSRFDFGVTSRVMFVTKEIINDLNLTKHEANLVQTQVDENVVNVKVQENAINAFESKIIGARQQVNHLMSEVARNVYENYKPPLSAFRISLNPNDLGSIAIVLKSNRSAVDVSMSMTNSNTYEVFAENQSLLRSQIARAFGENQNFNLSFSLQNSDANSASFGNSSGFANQEQQYSRNFGNRSNNNDTQDDEVELAEQSYM